MLLIGNILVIKARSKRPLDGVRPVPSSMPTYWEYYKIVTESVPEVEDSSVHNQLLHYNMGPLSCLVRTKAHGTMQEIPTSIGPSAPPQTRELHGIDVIKAGQGVLPTAAFHASARLPFRKPDLEAKRLRTFTPRLWLAG